ncbi:hypothetical protein C5708_09485 [Caulobacter sp. CCUG 60055]|uniref:hypothetical protein n=1 Tax=Caulobacter sp. CCUG 60055 TaxID=2100090 RepID=UPI001FA7E58E|nr:hypothetical protein [Caulobacter sp. CCUG 60055]MCI3180486.1 hypothetical protein [Caulobacter sp. CCUG 60055]
MTPPHDPIGQARAWLERYESFGGKASGGEGDLACGAWLEEVLRGLGYAVRRQLIETPWFETADASLAIEGHAAEVLVQAPAVQTSRAGLTAPLRLFDADRPANVAGAIALIVLPHGRWSSVEQPAVAGPLAAAAAAGARGAVLVTVGPSGEALALNAPSSGAAALPTAILAPREAAPFISAARRGASAALTLLGRGGRRQSFNLIGRMGPGGERSLVVSTPRSGWFGCMGERGPGLAVWLSLAERLAERPPAIDVAFVCTSGHEYESAGGKAFLRDGAPRPAETALWLHLGANVAARDWHEAGGNLAPLPSADPQRFLVATEGLVPLARAAFAGLAGLEAAYPAAAGAAGEAADILAAGYARTAGIFGAHRLHHARGDDGRCVEPALAVQVADAAERFIRGALA